MYAAAEWWSARALGGQPGLFKSADGGSTWARVAGGLSDPHVRKVVVAPDPPANDTLYVLTWTGIERSTDAGLHWSLVTNPGPDLSDLTLSPAFAADHTVFATSGQGRIYVSTDGGGSWTSVATNAGDPMHPAVSPNYAVDKTVCHGARRNEVVYCSMDGGSSWSEQATGNFGWFFDSSGSGIAFSPNFAADRVMFAISVAGISRSTDGGMTWAMLRGLRDYGNRNGVWIGDGAAHNTVGPGNVISNNDYGVVIQNGSTSYNTVAGNLIGTDPSGLQLQSNTSHALGIWGGHDNVLGGDTPEERNVVYVAMGFDAIALDGTDTVSNTVSGNYIGTNAAGGGANTHRTAGIAILGGASYNTIGGAGWGERQPYQQQRQRYLNLLGAHHNTVRGNYIGTNRPGRPHWGTSGTGSG